MVLVAAFWRSEMLILSIRDGEWSFAMATWLSNISALYLSLYHFWEIWADHALYFLKFDPFLPLYEDLSVT